MEHFKLNNGTHIPKLAYGTWLIKNSDAYKCVSMALDAGYRHIDTAQVYRNECEVGRAIREYNLPREDIYLVSKVNACHKDYKSTKRSIYNSLRRLGVDYIDLMLIHCPQPWNEYGGKNHYYKENVEVWRALEEAYKEGKVKAIGVSNFNKKDIANILDHCEIRPMVNQIEVHIYNTPLDLINYCKDNDIIVESYSPIAHGAALDDKVIKDMANKYHVSVAQLCIKYTLQLDTVSIPKASSKEHMVDNMKLDFEISEEDIKYLSKLNKNIIW